MSLGGLLQSAVDVAVRTVTAAPPGAGVSVGVYTPAGGTARPATHAAVRITEQPNNGVQRRGARITLYLLEVATEPTDGATYVADGITWTIRTARRTPAAFVCEAWA
jgi:hypothetical protein